jgi:biopolymer transport protein ExbB
MRTKEGWKMGVGGKQTGSTAWRGQVLFWGVGFFILAISASNPVLAQAPEPPVAAAGASIGGDRPVSSIGSAEPQAAGAKAMAAGTLPSALPHDLSPWGMFLGADLIVKAVMVGLAFASLVTWTVALAKILELWSAKLRLRQGMRKLNEATSLGLAEAALADKNTIVGRLIAGALSEAQRSGGLSPDGIKERATALLTRIEARGGRLMTRGTGLLATIGATAPFVGLFGTVWGIMNSFIGISKTNTTNLAVVAPGIAEALLATAFGLIAAIPAVIIYNALARSINGYKAALNDVTAEVLRHLSRDLDRNEEAHVDLRIVPRQSAE